MELAVAIIGLIGSLSPIAVKLFNDKDYTEAQAKADASDAVDAFVAKLAGMPGVIAANDAEANKANE